MTCSVLEYIGSGCSREDGTQETTNDKLANAKIAETFKLFDKWQLTCTVHCERVSLNSIYILALFLCLSLSLFLYIGDFTCIKRCSHSHLFAMHDFSAPFQLFLTYLSTVDERKREEKKQKKMMRHTTATSNIWIYARWSLWKRQKKKVSARTQLNLWYLSLCGCVDYNINAVIIVYFQKLFLCVWKINSFIAFLFMITADVYCDRGSEMKLKTCRGKMKK